MGYALPYPVMEGRIVELTGKLTEEQKKKFIDWLKEKGAYDLKCTACGKDVWRVSDTLMTTPVLSKGGIQLGGQTYPLISLICINCAHTVFFNAVLIGLMEPSKMEDKNG